MHRQCSRSRFVVSCTGGGVVATPIELDAQLQRRTIEIKDEPSNRMLTPEFVALQVAVPKPVPQRPLGRSRVLSQRTSMSGEIHTNRGYLGGECLRFGENAPHPNPLPVAMNPATGRGDSFFPMLRLLPSPLSPPQPHRGGERVRVRGASDESLPASPCVARAVAFHRRATCRDTAAPALSRSRSRR